MLIKGFSYAVALTQAQVEGFVESDPSLDVGGHNAANKLSILLVRAYGIIAKPHKLLFKGITQIHSIVSAFAAERNYQIKLTAQDRKLSNGSVTAFVLPQFVRANEQLYNLHNEYNGVVIESMLADKQFLHGKGAGLYLTSFVVLSDISALQYN